MSRSAVSSNADSPMNASGMAENEDEKVYYGFGVFMGLPLAQLKAMKEDYLRTQRLSVASDVSTESDEGSQPRGNKRSHESLNDATVSRTRSSSTRAGRHQSSTYPHSGDSDVPMQPALQRQGSNSSSYHGEHEHSDGQSDAGSDGSHANGTKSHSLNYILH